MNEEQLTELKQTMKDNRRKVLLLWSRHHDLNDRMRLIEKEIRRLEAKNLMLANLPAKMDIVLNKQVRVIP